MKVNKILILFVAIALLPFINGCEWVIDNDETKDSYEVSVFPMFTIDGEDFVSLQVGGTYTGPNVLASEIEAGGSDLTVYIDAVTRLNVVDGDLVETELESVDMSVAGVNAVTYAAENTYGYKRTTVAAAVVAQGDVTQNPDLSGTYTKSTKTITVSKYANGIWALTDTYPTGAYTLPGRFGDVGDGTYIMPPTITDEGYHQGFFTVDGDGDLEIYVILTRPDGSTKSKTATWTKQ